LREVRHQFGARMMHSLDRPAREFELPARFQRNRSAAGDIVEADDVRPFHDRLPAQQVPHAVKQRADAARAFVRNRIVPLEREREFLVLRPNTEILARL
jgi:hypothetical protein